MGQAYLANKKSEKNAEANGLRVIGSMGVASSRASNFRNRSESGLERRDNLFHRWPLRRVLAPTARNQIANGLWRWCEPRTVAYFHCLVYRDIIELSERNLQSNSNKMTIEKHTTNNNELRTADLSGEDFVEQHTEAEHIAGLSELAHNIKHFRCHPTHSKRGHRF